MYCSYDQCRHIENGGVVKGLYIENEFHSKEKRVSESEHGCVMKRFMRWLAHPFRYYGRSIINFSFAFHIFISNASIYGIHGMNEQPACSTLPSKIRNLKFVAHNYTNGRAFLFRNWCAVFEYSNFPPFLIFIVLQFEKNVHMEQIISSFSSKSITICISKLWISICWKRIFI